MAIASGVFIPPSPTRQASGGVRSSGFECDAGCHVDRTWAGAWVLLFVVIAALVMLRQRWRRGRRFEGSTRP